MSQSGLVHTQGYNCAVRYRWPDALHRAHFVANYDHIIFTKVDWWPLTSDYKGFFASICRVVPPHAISPWGLSAQLAWTALRHDWGPQDIVLMMRMMTSALLLYNVLLITKMTSDIALKRNHVEQGSKFFFLDSSHNLQSFSQLTLAIIDVSWCLTCRRRKNVIAGFDNVVV